jgi:hypothetical protein
MPVSSAHGGFGSGLGVGSGGALAGSGVGASAGSGAGVGLGGPVGRSARRIGWPARWATAFARRLSCRVGAGAMPRTARSIMIALAKSKRRWAFAITFGDPPPCTRHTNPPRIAKRPGTGCHLAVARCTCVDDQAVQGTYPRTRRCLTHPGPPHTAIPDETVIRRSPARSAIDLLTARAARAFASRGHASGGGVGDPGCLIGDVGLAHRDVDDHPGHRAERPLALQCGRHIERH